MEPTFTEYTKYVELAGALLEDIGWLRLRPVTNTVKHIL